MSNVQQPFLEIVHYTVKDPASFTAINERAAHALRPLTEGMGWWSHWRGEDAAERAEVVAWSSPATAYAAAETMERHPAMRFFMDALDEIKFMSHYHVENAPDWRALQQAGLLELALLGLEDAAAADPAHRALHAALTERPGVVFNGQLRQDGTTGGRGDLVLWHSPAVHQAAGRELPGDARFQPYFGQIKDMHVFRTFHLEHFLTNDAD